MLDPCRRSSTSDPADQSREVAVQETGAHARVAHLRCGTCKSPSSGRDADLTFPNPPGLPRRPFGASFRVVDNMASVGSLTYNGFLFWIGVSGLSSVK
jgi:hypothetical protein